MPSYFDQLQQDKLAILFNEPKAPKFQKKEKSNSTD